MVAWPEAGCRELFGSRMGERAFLELHVCMKVDRRGFGRFMPELCIPRKLDTDSTANWTRIPRESGQSERSDAGLKGFTLSLVLRSSFWPGKAAVWRYCVTDSLTNRRRFS